MCSDCGVVVVHVLPPPLPAEGPESDMGGVEETDDEGSGAELVEVWRSQGEIEAQVIRALLESNGIRSALRGEALRITHGLTMDGLAVVRILVRGEDSERARAILSVGGMLMCPTCGEPVRAGDAVCRSCGGRFGE